MKRSYNPVSHIAFIGVRVKCCSKNFYNQQHKINRQAHKKLFKIVEFDILITGHSQEVKIEEIRGFICI